MKKPQTLRQKQTMRAGDRAERSDEMPLVCSDRQRAAAGSRVPTWSAPLGQQDPQSKLRAVPSQAS